MLDGAVFHVWGTAPSFRSADGGFIKAPIFSRIIRYLIAFFPFLEKRMQRDKYDGLKAYFKTNRIECVLAEYGMSGASIADFCKKENIPLIVHFHGYDISKHQVVSEWLPLYRKMFASCTNVIAVSTMMQRALVELGAPSQKISLNYYGPAGDCFLSKADYGNNWFIAVGRFVEKKAPQLTILAFLRVLQAEESARLMMIGDGPLHGSCIWLAKSLGIDDKIRFEGALPHAETLQRFEQAFCFVQHSVTATNGDSEGTPVAVMEAGAAGLPVISTRHAGIPDVVVEEETGVLVEEGDVDAMAVAMLRLYRDRNLCAQMGAAARTRIREHFSMEKHIGILNDLIEKAINSNNQNLPDGSQVPNSKN